MCVTSAPSPLGEGAAFSSLMPFILLHFTGALGLTAAASGAILGAREIMPVFTGVAAGWLVAKIGSRSLVGVSMCILGLATAVWMMGLGGQPALWAAALFSGMASSAVRVGFSSSVADLTAKDEASHAFAILHACANVGFAVGPLLNTHWVSQQDYARAFTVPITLYLVASLFMFFGVPGNVGRGQREGENDQKLRNLVRQYGTQGLLFFTAVMLVIFFNGIRLQADVVGLGKYFVDYFHSTRATSFYWTVQSLAVVVLVPWSGRLMKGWALRPLFFCFAAGMALIAAGFWSLAWFGPEALRPAFASLILLSVLGECLCVPAYGALLVNLMGPRKAGLAFGLASTVAAVGMSLGASLGGMLLGKSVLLHSMPSYWQWVGILCIGAYAVALAMGHFALEAFSQQHAAQAA